jgi:hypothetical protein
MTLPELLDDLARSEPVAETPDLAARAWAGGRRRRRLAQVRGAVSVAAALAVVALLVPGVPAELPAGGFARSSSSAGVDGHPERIGRQWWVRQLPDRSGPMAALLTAENDRWYVVRADGHRWRLPAEDDVEGGQVAGLSPDGRVLAYLPSRSGPYVVHDLVSGRRTEFPEIYGHFAQIPDKPFQVHSQTPVHFSPDGRHLLLQPAEDAMLLLDVEGGVPRRLERFGALAGWAGSDRLVWLRETFPRPEPAVPLRAVITDLDGEVIADVPLEGTAGLSVNQWSGVVSPDGERMAVVTEEGLANGVVRQHSLANGARAAADVQVDVFTPCGPAWGGDRLVVPTYGSPGDVLAREVVGPEAARFTTVAGSIGGSCLIWAADAVAGPPRGGGLLGAGTHPLLWWWRELLLVAVAAAGLIVLLVRRRRRKIVASPVSWYE